MGLPTEQNVMRILHSYHFEGHIKRNILIYKPKYKHIEDDVFINRCIIIVIF